MPSRTTEGAGNAASWSGCKLRVRWSNFIDLYMYDQHTFLQAGQATIKKLKCAAIFRTNINHLKKISKKAIFMNLLMTENNPT